MSRSARSIVHIVMITLLVGCATERPPGSPDQGKTTQTPFRSLADRLLEAEDDLLAAERPIAAVPVEVLVAPSGKSMVVTRQIDPTSLGELRRTIPEYVPVYSVTQDGGRSLGVVARNDTDAPKAPNRRYPGLVVLLPSGKWIVDEVWFTIVDGSLAPGEEKKIPGSDDGRLSIGLDDQAEYQAPWIPPEPRQP